MALEEKFKASIESTQNEMTHSGKEVSRENCQENKLRNTSFRSCQTVVKNENFLESFPNVMMDLEQIDNHITQGKYDEALSLANKIRYQNLVIDTCKKCLNHQKMLNK